ncbi:hypothetical protein HY486_01405 [Candidatus Woesearchaeota archaeon]|nr:hypothetical protein [Candidatus Woesearchaeota archaeon]
MEQTRTVDPNYVIPFEEHLGRPLKGEDFRALHEKVRAMKHTPAESKYELPHADAFNDILKETADKYDATPKEMHAAMKQYAAEVRQKERVIAEKKQVRMNVIRKTGKTIFGLACAGVLLGSAVGVYKGVTDGTSTHFEAMRLRQIEAKEAAFEQGYRTKSLQLETDYQTKNTQLSEKEAKIQETVRTQLEAEYQNKALELAKKEKSLSEDYVKRTSELEKRVQDRAVDLLQKAARGEPAKQVKNEDSYSPETTELSTLRAQFRQAVKNTQQMQKSYDNSRTPGEFYDALESAKKEEESIRTVIKTKEKELATPVTPSPEAPASAVRQLSSLEEIAAKQKAEQEAALKQNIFSLETKIYDTERKNAGLEAFVTERVVDYKLTPSEVKEIEEYLTGCQTAFEEIQAKAREYGIEPTTEQLAKLKYDTALLSAVSKARGPQGDTTELAKYFEAKGIKMEAITAQSVLWPIVIVGGLLFGVLSLFCLVVLSEYR